MTSLKQSIYIEDSNLMKSWEWSPVKYRRRKKDQEKSGQG